jgi:hypothetical protein
MRSAGRIRMVSYTDRLTQVQCSMPKNYELIFLKILTRLVRLGLPIIRVRKVARVGHTHKNWNADYTSMELGVSPIL